MFGRMLIAQPVREMFEQGADSGGSIRALLFAKREMQAQMQEGIVRRRSRSQCPIALFEPAMIFRVPLDERNQLRFQWRQQLAASKFLPRR